MLAAQLNNLGKMHKNRKRDMCQLFKVRGGRLIYQNGQSTQFHRNMKVSNKSMFICFNCYICNIISKKGLK